MTTKSSNLLASSATLEGLQKMLNNYYYSNTYTISEELQVSNSKGKFNGVVIKKIKGRYKLYLV